MKTLCVFGTRPEAIKMAPLALALNSDPRFENRVCITGQHREMLFQVLDLFKLKPDFNLDIMKPGQDITDVVSSIILGMRNVFSEFKPDLVLVHGDTATTLAATLAAYFSRTAVAHIEAGLRTWDIYSPWPEEGNRKLTGALANFHLAPTEKAKENLLREGVSSEAISVTGNTVIDALLIISKYIDEDKIIQENLDKRFYFLDKSRKMILVTGHRRESFGDGFVRICNALLRLSREFPEIDIVYPVHLNPNVQKPVKEILGSAKNVYLIEPQEYLPFVHLMKKSYFIITDSGGIQEEAPSLGRPVLVMRDTTERPEAVAAGTVKLVGTSENDIFNGAKALILDDTLYENMSRSHNPYGDGFSSQRILDFIFNEK